MTQNVSAAAGLARPCLGVALGVVMSRLTEWRLARKAVTCRPYNRLDEPMITLVTCADCSSALPEEWVSDAAERQCPNCGSLKKLVRVELRDEVRVEVHDSLRGKVKDPSRRSKDKVRKDFFSGDDLRKSDGTWMTKERVLDRDNDSYMEKVVDPKTGEVVHFTQEPLSQHLGHGSAKPKEPPKLLEPPPVSE